MRPVAIGHSLCAHVAGRHDHGEPAVVDDVADLHGEDAAPALLRVDHRAEHDLVGPVAEQSPGVVGAEAVVRVVAGDLVDRHLVVDAVEGVSAVPDAVGPGEQLAPHRSARRLVFGEGPQHLLPLVGEAAQRRTHLGDDGRVRSGLDAVLLAGRQDVHV